MILQHSEGSLEGAVGKVLREVIAVSDRSCSASLAYYVLLLVGDVWHRLTIDEGVVLLSPTRAPTQGSHEDDGDELTARAE